MFAELRVFATVLILPNGKQVTLPIPPGAYNGQVIRLEGYGKPTTYNGTLGALILTIVVAEVDGGVSPVDVTVQQKFATPVMQSEISPTLPAVSSRRGQVRGSAILKMCLALVLLLGMASLFYFSVSRAISPLKGNTTATAVYATQAAATTTEVACPSYLPGCGTLALYDPLRDDSKGYDWHPPDYSGCDFLGGALHVSVNGDERGVSPADVTVQQKFPTPVMQSEISPTLPAVSSRRGQVRGSAILKMCLALVLLLGMASLFYFSGSRAFNSPPPPNPTATFCAQQNYPSYLPGCGTIALYDPLNFNKDTSQGYDWIPQAPGVPPQNGNCQFQGGALYVSVDGDNNYPVRFHPCGPDNTDFSNFAYQIKMTFIEGDCGGVIFRGQGEKIYYFYICQDGEYGIVRYTRDPDNGMPDLNLNPPLRTRATRSSFIIAGSSQANIIAVLARGSKIDLYVNQHLIDSVEDNNYRDGTIGVLAKALDLYRPTEVAFSDARVWTF